MERPLARDPIADAQRNWVRRGWERQAAPMAAVTAVMRTQQLLLARIEACLRPFALTFARYELLTLLAFTRRGEMAMSRASSLLQVHPTSVTNAVDRLQYAGLVDRVPHPEDRRTTLVRLTADGRELARRATDALNREVFTDSGFADDDVEALIGILARFRQSAGDFTP